MSKNPQRKVRYITGGSAFTVAQTESKHVYCWGMMSNAPRGEATMYPKMVEELYDWINVQAIGVGSNSIVVSASNAKTVAWGVCVAGRWGLEGDAKSSKVPKYLEKLGGYNVFEVGCGYGHLCFLLNESNSSNTFVNTLNQHRHTAEELDITAKDISNIPIYSPPTGSNSNTNNSKTTAKRGRPSSMNTSNSGKKKKK